MMAMSLYGGDNPANANPYLAPHALHHGKLARNPIELQARRLPRPRKSRKKREEEKPLYPSIAAVEEAVPEAIISVQDNGTLDIRLPEEELEEDAAASMEDEEEEEEDVKPAASPGSSSKRPSRPAHRTSRRRSSNSSESSEKLDQAFRRLSVKRKPGRPDMDDDPLGGTAFTQLAPRRKVSRHDSQHSADSGDNSSVSTDVSSGSRRHRQRSFDSMDSSDSRRIVGSTLDLGTVSSQQSSPKKKKTPPRENSHNKSALGKAGGSVGKKKHRRMKSYDSTLPQARAQELEIEPGVFLPLRGNDETLAAIKTGFVEEIFCQACDVELICIADANYCVCSDCKCISPVDGIASHLSPKGNKASGSVGLGLRASSQR